ncbi:MAG: hypothetical protein JNM89_02145 [Hyphomicrobiaceae bacterium]|nr:hypothetical protein [Hyphomicrobiaceae bacterium]
MRHVIRPFIHHFKWPIRVLAFAVHLMHQLAAFFAWAWMLVHMAATVAQAGLHANEIFETRVVAELVRDGMGYFASAGGLEWKKIMALAVVPAFLVALRNAWKAYEQVREWVHAHRDAAHTGPRPSP